MRPIRSSYLIVGAAVVAAYPTWDLRNQMATWSEEGEYFSCVGPYDGLGWSPVDPLRGDLGTLIDVAMVWGVPAILVLLCALPMWRTPQAAQRVACALTLMAVIHPATPLYSSPDVCGLPLPVFGAEWLEAVICGWGTDQVCWIGAAALLLASAPPAPVRELGTAARRVLAFLVDYVVVTTVCHAVQGRGSYGVLSSFDWFESEALAFAGFVFLYFWGQHALWGQTLGKRAFGLRFTGSGRAAALRALVFPLAVVVAAEGPFVLLAIAGLAALDPDGRAPYDRLTGADVTSNGAWLTRPAGGRLRI
ncbi:RDD family protein [Herbidospora cretacea]|uniref:RDD family protein n=1 Tax=Herbidospora cretacea TaxID=28444 RepID=UPI00077417F8|nr:RDD family protein [Herbidospora cretacea]